MPAHVRPRVGAAAAAGRRTTVGQADSATFWYRVYGGTAAVGVLLVVVGLFFLGKPKGTVTGRVTFRGRPVMYGAVVLVGKDGIAAAGRIETDGTYTVEKAPVGEVSVGVVSKDPVYVHRVTVLKNTREQVTAAALAPPPGVDRRKWMPLPQQYEDPTSSGLSTTIRKGTNEFDINLR
jgi:hypothetical protein